MMNKEEIDIIRLVAQYFELLISGQFPEIDSGTLASSDPHNIEWKDKEGRYHRIGGPATIFKAYGSSFAKSKVNRGWYFHGVMWKYQCHNCGATVDGQPHSCASSSACLAAGESDNDN